MTHKRQIIKIIVLNLMILFLNPLIIVKGEELNKIIILYDHNREFAQDEDKLKTVVNIAIQTNSDIDIVKQSSYKEGTMNQYGGVIILLNEENNIKKQLINDIGNYNGNIIWIGKNLERVIGKNGFFKIKETISNEQEETFKKNEIIKKIGNISFVPYLNGLDSEHYDSIKSYIIKTLRSNIEEGKRYFILDRIYAVQELSDFIKKIDYLYDRGMTFICSAMPVYENSTLLSMQNFTEMLRYAQSKGARVFLHGSDLHANDVNGNDLKNKMELAYKNFIDYGVYPIGIDMSENWIYREDYKEIYYKTNTIILDKDKRLENINIDNYTIRDFTNIIEKIDLKEFNKGYQWALYGNIGLALNVDLDFNEFKKEVEELGKKKMSISNPRYLNGTMELGDYKVISTSKNILVNGVEVNAEGFINKDEIKNKNQDKSKEGKGINLKQTNTIIIYVTVIVCGIFVIIAFISRRHDRKKYYK